MPTKVIAVGIDGTGSPEWRRKDGANSHVFRFITDINGVGNGNIEAGVRSASGSKKYFHGPNTRATDLNDIIDAAYLFVVGEMERLIGEGCAKSDIKLCLVGHSRGCFGVAKVANYLNGDEGSPKRGRALAARPVARAVHLGHAEARSGAAKEKLDSETRLFQEIEVSRADKLYVAVDQIFSVPVGVPVGYIGLYDTVDRAMWQVSINVAMPNVAHGRHARRQNRGFFSGSRSTFGTVDFPRFPSFDVDTAHGGVGGDPGYFTPLGQMSSDYYCNARQLIMTQEELTRAYGVHGSRLGIAPNYRRLTGSGAGETRDRLKKSVSEVGRADDYIRTGATVAGFSLAVPPSALRQYGEHDHALWRRMMSAISS